MPHGLLEGGIDTLVKVRDRPSDANTGGDTEIVILVDLLEVYSLKWFCDVVKSFSLG